MQSFYAQMGALASCRPDERYFALARIHDDVSGAYLQALKDIDEARARQRSKDGSRSILQVAGHIAAWDDWTTDAVGELFNGVRRPGIMDWRYNATGKIYPSDAEFNAARAMRDALFTWGEICASAVAAARRVKAAFSGFVDGKILLPNAVIKALEESELHEWKWAPREMIRVPCGWYLWMITVEHASIAHAEDLGLSEPWPTGGVRAAGRSGV
ncbi:MAG: hypothetical protein U1A16_00925 [Patescibacteria group bacterium]|nr:hypothetical protein [Patescibacteria group bacterium]